MRKKKYLLIVCCLAAIAVGVKIAPKTLPNPFPITITSPSPTAILPLKPSVGCDPTLWQHIYNPQRLQIIKDCISVTGVIEVVRIEADGDYHVLLRENNTSLINSVNITKQHGDLVVEPICENSVTQADAVSACQGFTQNIQPKVGQHVKVTGSYVLDTQHGWNELHPITSIEVIP